MASKNLNRIMIAGTNSGCGKTTITCALLKALKNRGLSVASFKCGPDYIDPMFHSEIIGAKSRNIDIFLCGEKTSRYLMAKNSEDSDLSVVEGVMGFYDGIGGKSEIYSSCDISNRMEIPVILVVDCSGAALSVVAMIKGYLELFKNRIVGVILNKTSKHMYELYKQMIEAHLSIKLLGFMPKEAGVKLESRHLGLVTASEVTELKAKTEFLAKIAEENIDIDEIITIARQTQPFYYEGIEIEKKSPVRIAVARDKAFCFYYEDNLELLRQMRAELVFFSPLEDFKLPSDVDGIILGGGYPELYAKALSENILMHESIRDAAKDGMPVFAECGGFMYLGKSISNGSECYPMVSLIDMNCKMTDKLQPFGYVTLIAKEDNLLMDKGQGIPAHEFHYSSSNLKTGSLYAKKNNGRGWCAGYSENNIFAGYPHIHFWSDMHLAGKFLNKCFEYKEKKKIVKK